MIRQARALAGDYAAREKKSRITHELSGKYHALSEYSRQLLDEAETILRRTKSATIGR